eukprot:Gregarina_sp_Poly_1__9450@NODE_592_length_7334_cov_17_757259_g457_i0_p5_GENE_NODE_592_length_7334_cov_17_757259_g457_i0NODE_592_length_7334_cov_17_757259_g457_i0_p5_ORF_typecomplete_len148_score4_55_NODE_592_length_7334_cov_17_757259_g457_i041494592
MPPAPLTSTRVQRLAFPRESSNPTNANSAMALLSARLQGCLAELEITKAGSPRTYTSFTEDIPTKQPTQKLQKRHVSRINCKCSLAHIFINHAGGFLSRVLSQSFICALQSLLYFLLLGQPFRIVNVRLKNPTVYTIQMQGLFAIQI